jgi:PAS domain S-box-containing protein
VVETLTSDRAEAVPGGDDVRFLDILENWNQGFAIRQGNSFVFVNQAFVDLCGYQSPEDVLSLGSSIPLVATHERERIGRYYEARVNGEDAPDSYVMKAVRKDGSLWWAENRVQSINWQGKPAVLIAINDISDRKHAEDALAESEERFKDFAEAASDWFWETDERHRFVSAPEEIVPGSSSTQQSIIGLTRFDLRSDNDEDDAKWRQHHADMEAHRPFRNFVFQRNNAGGEGVHIRINGTPFFDSMGRFLGYRGTGSDISDLVQREEKFRSLLESAPDAMVIVNTDGKVTDINRQSEALFGYTREELLGKSVEILVPERHAEAHQGYRQRYIGAPEARVMGQAGTLYAVTKSGAEIPVEISLNAIETGEGMLVATALRDISAREDAESELRASEQRFRSLVEGSIQGVIVHDELTILFANEEAAKILGYGSHEEFRRTGPIEDHIHRNDRDRVRNYGEARLHGKPAPGSYELRALRKDGSTAWLEARVTVVEWVGAPAIQSVFYDITDRKQAEEALKVSEAQAAENHALLVDAIESLSEGFALFDKDDRLVMMNSQILKFYEGVQHLWVPGTSFEEIVRGIAESGLEPTAHGREGEWLRERRERHRNPREPFERQLGPDQFFLMNERKTSGGGVVSVATDITELKRAERQLRNANEELEARVAERTQDLSEKTALLEATFESISEGFALFDQDDRLVFCNAKYKSTFAPIAHLIEPGVAYETLLRASFDTDVVLHSDDSAEARIQTRLAQHGDPGDDIEVELTDGRWLIINERRTGKGGVTLVHTEITKLKKVEAALRLAQTRFVEAVESLPMSFVIYDDEDRVVLANSVTEDFFPPLKGNIEPGTPAREMIRRNLDAKWFPDAVGREVEWIEERLANFRDKTPYTELVTAAGRTLLAMDRSTSDGGTVAIRLDVTEEKKNEQALLKAKELADVANRAKSEFLSSMSHELRTPLNAIMGFAQMLKEYSDQPLTNEQSTSVRHILSAGNHLLGLINEVLDLARIEAGRLDLSVETVDLMQVIRESVTLVQPLAKRAQVNVSVNADGVSKILVEADRNRLKQVLLNVLSNAVKYNRANGAVTVSPVTFNGAVARINVSDTGPGIPADRHDEVFRPFSRIGAEASKIEGTGIGLTISRQLVESMGGSLDFESAVGEGSTFWVELPIGAN